MTEKDFLHALYSKDHQALELGFGKYHGTGRRTNEEAHSIPPANKTFKEILTSVTPFPSNFNIDLNIEEVSDDDEECIEKEDDTPSIKLIKDEKMRVRRPWINSLIVKVLGRTVHYGLIEEKIKNLWKPTGRIQVIDLEEGFFLVKMEKVDDYNMALHKGPWFIGSNMLTLRKWEANFQPKYEQEDVTSVVWMRLPNLPVEYFDRTILSKIGATVGSLLKVNVHTGNGSKGRFVRICVQVKLNKPMLSKIKIGKAIQTFSMKESKSASNV